MPSSWEMQLFNCLPDRKVLDFRFFAGRFDAVIAELKESDSLHRPSSFKKRSSTTAAAMAAEGGTGGGGGQAVAVPAHTSLRTRLSR